MIKVPGERRPVKRSGVHCLRREGIIAAVNIGVRHRKIHRVIDLKLIRELRTRRLAFTALKSNDKLLDLLNYRLS